MRYSVGRIVIGNFIFTNANIALASGVQGKTVSSTMRYAIETAFNSSGKRFAPRFEVDEGESIEVRSDHAGILLIGKFQVQKTSSATTVRIKASINNDGLTIAQSTLITTLGQSSGILVDTEQGPVELNLLVTELG